MRILELELLSKDLEQTEHFYTNILGFTKLSASSNELSLAIGASKLTFRKTLQAANPVYHFAFNIAPNLLASAQDWLSQRLELLPINEENTFVAHFEDWNANSVYFLDNNQNVVEFIARHDLPSVETHDFSPNEIYSLSEFGVVLPAHIIETASDWAKKYQLPLFRNLHPHANFTTLGTNEGILIFAHQDRPWFPTHIKAQPHWARINISSKGGMFEIEPPI
jgi:catechol 2,3-dioxygenase-like lactoylglutathione lyase family enzyme